MLSLPSGEGISFGKKEHGRDAHAADRGECGHGLVAHATKKKMRCDWTGFVGAGTILRSTHGSSYSGTSVEDLSRRGCRRGGD